MYTRNRVKNDLIRRIKITIRKIYRGDWTKKNVELTYEVERH